MRGPVVSEHDRLNYVDGAPFSKSDSLQSAKHLHWLGKFPHSPFDCVVVKTQFPVLGTGGLVLIWNLSPLDPMEEDILQVVKYCTDLIEEKDLEKLDLVIKYMKR